MYIWSGKHPAIFNFYDIMEKTRLVTIDDCKYELHVPTMRTKVQIESAIARSTGGSETLMSLSGSDACRQAVDLAYKLAYCNSLVTKLDKADKPDYEFSFYDLDDDSEPLLDKVYTALTDFIKEYKNGRN